MPPVGAQSDDDQGAAGPACCPQVLIVASERATHNLVGSALAAAGITTTCVESVPTALERAFSVEFAAIFLASDLSRRSLFLLHNRFPSARLVACLEAQDASTCGNLPLSGIIPRPLVAHAVAYHMGAVIAVPPKPEPDGWTLVAIKRAEAFSVTLGLRGERPAIVSWIVQRLGYKEIAWRLERSVGTVEYHMAAIFRQSRTVDREELTLRVLLPAADSALRPGSSRRGPA